MNLRDGGPAFWNKFTLDVLETMEQSEWERIKKQEHWRVRSVMLKLFTHTIELFSTIIIRVFQALLSIPATLGHALFLCTQIAWCLLCGYFLYLLFFHGACHHAALEFEECRREMPLLRNFHSMNEGIEDFFQMVVEHLKWDRKEGIDLCDSHSDDPIHVLIQTFLEASIAPVKVAVAFMDVITPIYTSRLRNDQEFQIFVDMSRSFLKSFIECSARGVELLVYVVFLPIWFLPIY